MHGFKGIVFKRKNIMKKALECFWNLNNIIQCDPSTIYQIGHISQLNNDYQQAINW